MNEEVLEAVKKSNRGQIHNESAVHQWWKRHIAPQNAWGRVCEAITDDPKTLLDALAEDGLLTSYRNGVYTLPHHHTWRILNVVPARGTAADPYNGEIMVEWKCSGCLQSEWGSSVVAAPPPTA